MENVNLNKEESEYDNNSVFKNIKPIPTPIAYPKNSLAFNKGFQLGVEEASKHSQAIIDVLIAEIALLS